mgnify:CR=1 FL=1
MSQNTDVRIKDFKRVLFFTGAGLSAASGIPTYRGKGGTWSQYNWQECACQEAFDKEPERVWEFHNVRRTAVAGCEPNDAHRAIARCGEDGQRRVTVVTQNIDGLHQKAGSKEVIELHGSLWRLRAPDGSTVENFDVPLTALRAPAGHWWRPDITWFGDALNEKAIQMAAAALTTCDLLVSIGTSAVVYPAAQMPVVAKQAGATLVEVNPEATPLSDIYDVTMRMTAEEAMKLLCEGL